MLQVEKPMSPWIKYMYMKRKREKESKEGTQAEIKIAGRNINNLRYVHDTTLWQKVKRN